MTYEYHWRAACAKSWKVMTKDKEMARLRLIGLVGQRRFFIAQK